MLNSDKNGPSKYERRKTKQNIHLKALAFKLHYDQTSKISSRTKLKIF